MVSLPLRIRPTILLFNDSITQQAFGFDGLTVGWASLLARDYSRRADVLSRGFSGYNTKHAVDILPEILESDCHHPVLFTTVFFGANDAALPGELQHVPIEEYGKNLANIVTQLRSSLRQVSTTAGTTTTICDASTETTQQGSTTRHSDDDDTLLRTSSECTSSEDGEERSVDCEELPIILLTPPPVDIGTWYKERGLPKDKPNDRANENAKLYGNKVKEVGNVFDCPVVDVFDLLGGNGPVDRYGIHLRDGLHLSESGNVLVYEGIRNLLQQEYSHLMPMKDGNGRYGTTGVPLDGKLWRELC